MNTKNQADQIGSPSHLWTFVFIPSLFSADRERFVQQLRRQQWAILHKLQNRNSFDEDKKIPASVMMAHTFDEHGHGRVRRAHLSSYQGVHRGRLPGKWTFWMFSSWAAQSQLLHLYPPANQKNKYTHTTKKKIFQDTNLFQCKLLKLATKPTLANDPVRRKQEGLLPWQEPNQALKKTPVQTWTRSATRSCA